MSKNKDTVIIRERVYIPIHMINTREVKEEYTKLRYDDKSCKKCEYLPDRHSYLCDECPSYLGKIKLYNQKTIKGRSYLGIPVGDKKNFERKTGLVFSEIKISDKRRYVPFDYKIKFIIPMRDYQQPVVDKFLEKRYGLIEAPPRTGKTAMMLYCGVKLGQRMLMLANQHEFVEQFLDHIHGNEKEGIPKCTNLPDLEEKYGKKLYGTPKTDEDFKNFQIYAMTYQAFLSEKNGKNRFKKLDPYVGTIGIDEVHKSAADGFSRTVQRFRARYRFGVSATIDRKDGLQFVVKNILGPVVAKSDREALTPTVILHKTEVKGKSFGNGKGAWVRMLQYISKDKGRNKLIVEWVLKDLAKGHNIVIPVQFKKHVTELRDLINEAYGKDICEIFVGGGGKKNKLDRKEILARAKANKTRVIVGIRSLLQLGLNVPQWSAIYEVIPISNEPNLKQETKRVCTPLEDKRPPIIRLFFDQEIGPSVGCARNSYKHMQKFKYTFMRTEKQAALVQLIFGGAAPDPTENSDDADFKAHRSLFDKPVTSNRVARPRRL